MLYACVDLVDFLWIFLEGQISSKDSKYVSPGGVGEGTSCVCSSRFSLLLLRSTMSARKGKVMPEMAWIWEQGGVGRDH